MSQDATSAIEIGSLFGYSAILIAGCLPPGGRLTCVEANGYLARFVRSNPSQAGFWPCRTGDRFRQGWIGRFRSSHNGSIDDSSIHRWAIHRWLIYSR